MVLENEMNLHVLNWISLCNSTFSSHICHSRLKTATVCTNYGSKTHKNCRSCVNLDQFLEMTHRTYVSWVISDNIKEFTHAQTGAINFEIWKLQNERTVALNLWNNQKSFTISSAARNHTKSRITDKSVVW